MDKCETKKMSGVLGHDSAMLKLYWEWDNMGE